jgi:hypothetical protein
LSGERCHVVCHLPIGTTQAVLRDQQVKVPLINSDTINGAKSG